MLIWPWLHQIGPPCDKGVDAAGYIGDAHVALGQGPSFSTNGALYVGNGQQGNSGGCGDFQVALAPVGLPLPCEGPVLGAVPQLMLLNEVKAQDEQLV